MQLWNSFVQWFTRPDSLPVLFAAIVLVVAVILASVLATLASRGAVSALIRQRDRELQASALGALVDAATEASVWSSCSLQQQVLIDRAIGQADIQLRLLPVRGSSLAARWASHQLAEIKRASGTFGYQQGVVVQEFRDRLLDWQQKPGRARKIFQGDLDRWQLQGEQEARESRAEESQLPGTSAFTQPRTIEPLGGPTALGGATGLGSTAPLRGTAAAPEETRRLLDDVEALDVRPAGNGGHSAPVLPV